MDANLNSPAVPKDRYPADLLGEHTLANGRKYKLADTGREYVGGEYPDGGIWIGSWCDELEEPRYLWISYAPDEECAREFLRLVARNKSTPFQKD